MFTTTGSVSRQSGTRRSASRGTRRPLIVIDASALLEILLQTQRADRLMERAFDASERIHAPHLLDIEVDAGTASPRAAMTVIARERYRLERSRCSGVFEARIFFGLELEP
jgi:hypothetical protein